MDYFFHLKDSNGYIHSIDNLIITYSVKRLGLACLDEILDRLHSLKEKYDTPFWEKLDLNPCRKYSFFKHAVHLDDGIYILLGHYADYQKDKAEMLILPLIRLEINPNKHANKPIFTDLMKIIHAYCCDSYISRYDYAVDIPVTPDQVQVFGTNKEKGLYKGTRYFGQRNKNGFCRIYDKQKEQKLDTPLTRVEHVVSLTKTTKALSFEKIFIKSESVAEDDTEVLSKTDAVILELCALASANGLDYESVINGLSPRKRRFIKSKVNQCGYKPLEFEQSIHDKLLQMVKDYFGVKDSITEDANGFIHIEDDAIPFE